MAAIFPTGIQFCDASGIPLAGGSVYFYSATTTTPKLVYDTPEQVSALANPITLDAEGRLRGTEVWGLGDYRIIIKDADGTSIYDIDHVNIVNPYDWTGLTATINQLNALGTGTPGTVVANTIVVVDASKNIATFGDLTAARLIANTSVKTPLIKDTNSVTAITVAAVSSQVNSVTVTPAITTVAPTISASGGDSNIGLKLAGKGTGKIQLSGIKYPSADGTSGYAIQTDGAGTTSFSLPSTGGLVQEKVTSSVAAPSSLVAIPFDGSIPQNTEGTEITDLATSITPMNSSNNLLITLSLTFGVASGTPQAVQAAIFQDSVANGTTILFAPAGSTTTVSTYTGVIVLPASSTSARTYKVRFGPFVTTGTARPSVNITGGSILPLTMSLLEIREIAP